jgi:deazaflavin-dependent oxidoreductase (nitroreductase family)
VPNGLAIRVVMRLLTAFHHLRGDRVVGLDLLYLTTVGARSGRRRTAPLAWFADGDRRDSWIVVASNGGAARNPSWYGNLCRRPGEVWIEVGGRIVHVAPEQLAGGERAERWREIVARDRRYAGYQARTDREIPILRLVAA